ncbi:MAG: VTT domain-containing protein [Micrococcales bacterium]|nr:VTT domain-containing protein [Micrococcales bacterium]
MVDWIMAQHFAVAAITLTVVAAVRSQCTYWLGRAVRSGVVKSAWAQRLSADGGSKGRRWLERRGWPIIPLSFLTIGLQTAVNLAAGLVGWRWPRYTLAAIPGWIAWGVIYAAGGLAIFGALMALAKDSPMRAAAIIQLVVCLIVAGLYIVSRRRASKG